MTLQCSQIAKLQLKKEVAKHNELIGRRQLSDLSKHWEKRVDQLKEHLDQEKTTP